MSASYLYLIPIIMALVVGGFYLTISEVGEKKMIDKPFLNEFSNELYVLSYSAPFKWFINPTENQKQKDIEKLIVEANESHRLNYRVYTTIQTLILIGSVVLFSIFSLLANNSVIIIKYLFNITLDISSSDDLFKVKLFVGLFLLCVCLIPSTYLKRKAKNNKFYFLKDFPILQLFIILMLKAKRPLNEVIYVLSTTNTIYKPIFATAYRMYVGDRQEGIEYLKKAFLDTKFEETIKVLEEYGEYSKEHSMTVLENNLKDITEYTNTLKRRKDIGANVFSQLSLAIPFLAVMLLGFGPLVYYGINLLNPS